jgi:predicted nucleic acid-binding protein
MKIFLDANICLDLLDSKRTTSENSINWYMKNKDNEQIDFYFSADFITTIYYILTEKRKHNPQDVITTIDALTSEISPFYLSHSDFLSAKNSFLANVFNDFEDLMVLESASRLGSETFVTNDKELLGLGQFRKMDIISPEE